MELRYKKEMDRYDLNVSDLTDDAKTGIEQIQQVQRAVNMLEKKGKNPTNKTLNKIKAMDKWVSYEIIDMVNETEQNMEEMPYESDEVIDDIEEQIEESENIEKVEAETIETDPRGIEVENEIKSLFESGNKKLDIEELQSSAPVCYNILFDTYEPEEDNGIETTRYKLLEREDGMFHVTKK